MLYFVRREGYGTAPKKIVSYPKLHDLADKEMSNMKKAAAILAFISLTQVMPSSVLIAKERERAIVSVNHLNIRTLDSVSAPIIGSLNRGEQATVLSERNGWAEIEFGDKKGWVSSVYLKAAEQSFSKKVEKRYDKGFVTSETLNMRKNPGLQSPIIGKLMAKDNVEIIETEGDWSFVRNKEGFEGWVSSQYLSKPIKGDKFAHSKERGSETGLTGRRIVIDPGHGGMDQGTEGKNYDTLESDVTLRTGNLVAEKLRASGATVLMTRMDNRYLSKANRVLQSDSAFADAFVSLHYNSSVHSDSNGLSTYYYDKAKDLNLAQSIQSALIKENTGLADRKVQFGNFYVVRENKKPSVLVELGFLSNVHDEYLAGTPSFQDRSSTGIVEGLKHFFANESQ